MWDLTESVGLEKIWSEENAHNDWINQLGIVNGHVISVSWDKCVKVWRIDKTQNQLVEQKNF
jgi:hypothetical protein